MSLTRRAIVATILASGMATAFACDLRRVREGGVLPAAQDTPTASMPGPSQPRATPVTGAGRHGRPRQRGPGDPRDRERRARSTRVVRSSGQVPGPAGERIEYALREARLLTMPGEVDSNSPAFWDGDRFFVFTSAYFPVRSVGPRLDALSEPREVRGVGHRPGGWWLEAVWKDPSSGLLYGWYHLEPEDLACLTAPVIGAATSTDNGLTWTDLGPVIENQYPLDCETPSAFFAGGNGDFSVVLDPQQQYFYFLFTNYAGPLAEQGVAVARSAFADRGQPGTLFKYFAGAWDEPGLGGRVTPIFPTTTGWHAPHVEAFWGPSVHWNVDLQLYVVLLNRVEGTDWQQRGRVPGREWRSGALERTQKLLDSEGWYPQVMGPLPGGTHRVAGSVARLFIHGTSQLILEWGSTAAATLR